MIFSDSSTTEFITKRKRFDLTETDTGPHHRKTKEKTMKKNLCCILICVFFTSLLFGQPAQQNLTYTNGQRITAEEGKRLLDNGGVTLVDVRRQDEYAAGHIKNAILIPNETINTTQAPKELPDKNAVILVYCRTGIRAGQAAQKLMTLGYKHVYNMGGIVDWPYGTVR